MKAKRCEQCNGILYLKCEGTLPRDEDSSPIFWCECPALPPQDPNNDDPRDPSEIEGYYDSDNYYVRPPPPNTPQEDREQ